MKCRLIFVLIIAIFSQEIFAQSDTIKLSEVVVNSAANPDIFKQTARPVQIIESATLMQAPATNIGDILEQLSGIDLRQRGTFGMQADLNIRGGSFDQSLILINGIAVNDPQSGHLSLDLALNKDDISKIEVIEGPTSRWFGANAFSGGINIITKSNTKNEMNVGLTGGQHGLFGIIANGNYRTGKITQHSSIRFLRSSGYQRDTDFKDYSLNHSARYTHNNTKAALQLSYRNKAFGAYDFYTAKYPDQFEQTRTFFESLSFETGNTVQIHGAASWRRHYDRFELFRETGDWYKKQGNWYIMDSDSAGFRTPRGFYPYAGPNYHRTDVINLNSAIRFQSVIGKTALGVNFSHEKIISNILGLPMQDTIISKIDRGGFYDHKKNRNNLNLFLNQRYNHKHFNVSGGINTFYDPDYGFYFNPGIDVAYFLTGHLKIFVSTNRGMRIPTFTDLFYQGPDHISNPNLKPEVVYETEAGFKYFHKNLIASVSVFYRVGNNLIDWVRENPQEKWESKNLTKLHTKGFSLGLVYKNETNPKGIFKAIRLNYTYLMSDKNSDKFLSLYALDYLKHNLSLFVDNRIAHHLTAGWSFLAQKRNGSYYDSQQKTEKPYENVFLINAKITYYKPLFVIYLQANNLLNRPYHDIGSVLMPGIWVMGGVQFHFLFHKKNGE